MAPSAWPRRGQQYVRITSFAIITHHYVLLKADLNAYLGKLAPGSKIHSLAELIAFNARESAREMPFFGQET